MNTGRTNLIHQPRVFAWIAAGTGLVLLLPLVAMQFSTDVVWTLSDFVAMGVLVFGTASLFVVAARRVPGHRALIGAAFVLAFLYLWAELAVGIFTDLGS